MIRCIVFALVTAVFGLSAPVCAGTLATYAGETPDKVMTIEVADNGDARISDGTDGDYGLMLGGHFYIVGSSGGALRVARIEDVAAAIDQVIPPVFRGLLSGARTAPARNFRAVRQGTRTVAGQTGTVYLVYGLNDQKPDEAQEIVLSSDPALRPIGAAMEQFMNAAIVPAAPLIGEGAADIIASTRAIFALGTPLDVGRFRLTSLTDADVPPARLALPAKASTVDELVNEMRSMLPSGQ
jgi:hypothetical protein